MDTNAIDNNITSVFISWSGDFSKKFAEELKRALESDVFKEDIKCFVSTQDIASGEDWYKKIESELKKLTLEFLL